LRFAVSECSTFSFLNAVYLIDIADFILLTELR